MDTSLSTMNKRVVKEPLGFIRVLQLPIAILALATTAGYAEVLTIPFVCTAKQETKSVDWGYPFDLTSIRISANFCIQSYGPVAGGVALFKYGASSQAQFFVCTGVLSFLYVLAILGVYVLSWDSYTTKPRWPMVDAAVTGVLALFWFIASCAWASGLTMVKTATDADAIGNRLRGQKGAFPCNTAEPASKMCTPTQTWNYAALNISLILGFACFGLWVANLWFIYKETIWYKNRAGAMNFGTQPGVTPAGPQFGVPPAGQATMAPGMGGGANIRPPASEFQY